MCVDESLCRVRAKKEERGVITVNAPAKKKSERALLFAPSLNINVHQRVKQGENMQLA